MASKHPPEFQLQLLYIAIGDVRMEIVRVYRVLCKNKLRATHNFVAIL